MTQVLALPMLCDATRPLDPREWIVLDDAAEILGRHVDHLSKLCRTQLVPLKLACMARPADGGKPRWYLARRYDLRLSPGEAGKAFQLPDLSAFSARQQELAWQRAQCVEQLRAARAVWRGRQQDWLPHLLDDLRREYPGVGISDRSLRRWYATYNCPREIVNLIDRRGGNTRGAADPAAWDHFRSLYLDQREPSRKSCWRRTKEAALAHSWRWTTYRRCCAQLDEQIPPAIQAKYRRPREAREGFDPYLEQDPEAFGAGERWDGDHTQLDFWCCYGGQIIRPWLTAWKDWRSRRVTGYVLSAGPNSSTILAALRAGLSDPLNQTVPAIVWIDNGKDYDSYTFHGRTKATKRRVKFAMSDQQIGLFKLLDVDAHTAIPHNPNGKSRLERWFGTVHDQFDKTFATYCGRNADHRPDYINALLKDERHKVPRFEHVVERLVDHIRGWNASTDHYVADLQGMSPDQALAELCATRRTLADPSVLDLLLQQWHEPVKVGRNGITIHPLGRALRYGQFVEALLPYKRMRQADAPALRVSYDPQDLRQIRVYDAQWRFICDAPLNAQGGRHGDAISREHVAQLNRDKAAYRKAQRVVRSGYRQEYLSDAELLAEAAARDTSARAPQAKPDVLKSIQTPLDGASKAIESERFRQAAGAEFNDDDGPSIYDGGGLEGLAALAASRRDDDDDEPLNFDLSASLTVSGDDDDDTDVVLDLSVAGRATDDEAGHLLDQMR